MWWRKEKAKLPFTGSSFDAALNWCQSNNEKIEIKSQDAFEVFLGEHVVHVERFLDDDWLHAWAILPDSPFDMSEGKNLLQIYQKFAERQFKRPDVIMDIDTDGAISIRFLKLMKFQGNPNLMIFNMLSTFDYILNGDESRLYPVESTYFFLDGRRHTKASEAALAYFKGRGLKRVEINETYVSYDTGGLPCVVSLTDLGHEFNFRYAFGEFRSIYHEILPALSAQYMTRAYGKSNPKVSSYMFNDGVAELSISGVLTEGTEAMPIFDRTLAELTQVVLDSMELVKLNPGLVKGTQIITSEAEALELVSKYHGDKTGGAENLVE